MPDIDQIKSILSEKTVGIAGAGDYGSNTAALLVKSGVGKLIIAGCGSVAEDDVNRQFYFCDQRGKEKVEALRDNLLKINPLVILQMHRSKITPQNISLLFSTCDVVVEALDEAEEKEMFIGQVLIRLPHIPLVAASKLSGLNNIEKIKVVKNGLLYICGAGGEDARKEVPLLAPKVNIVSCQQAETVLRILLGFL